MPQIVKHIRHNDTVARLGANGFVPHSTRDAAHRCGPSCTCRRSATRSGVTDAVTKLTRSVDKFGKSLASDSLEALLPRLHDLADRRWAMLDAAKQPSGLVSATSGYVRDAAGNRLRPMTTADMQAIANQHYGRA